MGKDEKPTKIINKQGPASYIFFMAFVGALVYFVQQAHGFGAVLLALLKACVWPAYLVFHVLQNLGA